MTLFFDALVRWGRGVACCSFILGLSACGGAFPDGDGSNRQLTSPPAGFELVGTWVDNYGGTTVLDEATWGSAELAQFDNDDNWAITQMPADDEWNPSKFSQVVWTETTQEAFWTCTVAYGLESVEEAVNAESITDDFDPASGGCRGFAWTRMQRELEVAGTWSSEWGEEAISGTRWDSAALRAWSNLDNWAITQMPADDEWNPSKFSRVVWTEAVDGAFFYCIVAYGLETQAEAEATENTPDTSDPATGGCGDFPWTALNVTE
jgi:hypothetical protein